jgi:cellulose biosynthesis protein BcsQ
MAPTVALVNQKGGVGKTSVTLGLASAAWAADDRVLVVDLDPQGSATWMLGVDPHDGLLSAAELIDGSRRAGAREAVLTSAWGEQVDLIPAVPRLTELDGVSRKARLDGLASGLAPLAGDYDAILIDCPPNLGTLTMNGLVAAEQTLIVVEPSVLSVRAVAAVLATADMLKAEHSREVSMAGVIVNKLPAHSLDAEQQFAGLDHAPHGIPVWRPPIPQRVAVPKAASARRPVHSFGGHAVDVADALDHLWLRLRRLLRRSAPRETASG